MPATRIEVSAQQRLDQEHSRIYSASQRMFVAALAGERARAEELQKEQSEAVERAAREEHELAPFRRDERGAERQARLVERVAELGRELSKAEQDRAGGAAGREPSPTRSTTWRASSPRRRARGRAALEAREQRASRARRAHRRA